jgi:lysophospholipase L1-like esterase
MVREVKVVGLTNSKSCVFVGFYVLVLLFVSLNVLADSGDESLNLTLQNQRIMCWGVSGTVGTGADPGESYPEHLGRILGRETERLLNGMTADCLNQVNMFEEDKYGIIICQFGGWDVRQYVPLQEMEDNIRKTVQHLRATGAIVVLWDHVPLWDLDGQITTTKEKCSLSSSTHPEIACSAIGDETQTAYYYKAWGNMTLFHRICEEEGALFIPHSAFHDCVDDSCPPNTRMHTDLLADDRFHLNSPGYGVFAERVAGYLVDWGLGDYAVDFEKLSLDLSTHLTEAEGKVKILEDRNHSLSAELSKRYEMVKLLQRKGYLYTANRTLVSEVLSKMDIVLDHWDEVIAMFPKAEEAIKVLEQQGKNRDALFLKADYTKAETAWQKYEYDATKMYLQKIIDKVLSIPEPAPRSIIVLCLILLSAPLLRAKHSPRKAVMND